MRVNVSSVDYRGLNNKKMYQLTYIPAKGDTAVFIVRDKMAFGNDFVFSDNASTTFAYLYNAEQILFFGGENVRTLSAGSSSKRNKKICRDETNILLTDNGYLFQGQETSVDLYNGYFCNDESGEVTYQFRGIEKLRRDYRKKADEMQQHIMEGVSVFGTFSSDKKYSADEIKNIGSSNFSKWLKRKYRNVETKELVYWVIVFEPCNDGSWHFHFVLSFKKEVPADFAEQFASWAERYNDKPCSAQTNVQTLHTKFDVLKVIDYLDPTSEKKKARAVFYPARFRNIIINGDRKTPKSLLGTGEMFSEVFEKLDAEFIPEFSRKYILVDEDTNEVIYEPCEMWFYVDKGRLNECISEALFEAIANDEEAIITGKFMQTATRARGSRGTPLAPMTYEIGLRSKTSADYRSPRTRKTARSKRAIAFASGCSTASLTAYVN